MEDRMLSDEILLGIINSKSGGGGGGGTTNYNDLSNQPQINGNTLTGNKSASDLGLADSDTVDGILDGTNIDSFADVETALAGKQGVLTAGKYIDIDENNEISVDPVVPNEAFTYLIEEPADYTLHVTKSVDGVVTFEETYIPTTWDVPIDVTLDNAIRIYTSLAGIMFYELVIASDTHDAGFKQNMQWFGRGSWTETFSTVDHSGEKLITKSELDTALATKADLTDLAPAFSTATAYTVGQYVSYDGNIYKCTSAHSAGAWAAGDFTLVAVGSELESKQNATDNSLQTTDKTVVGAVNELKSGLTNVNSGYISKQFVIINGASIYDFVRDIDTPTGYIIADVQGATDNPIQNATAFAVIYKPIANGNYSLVKIEKSGQLFISGVLLPNDTAFTFTEFAKKSELTTFTGYVTSGKWYKIGEFRLNSFVWFLRYVIIACNGANIKCFKLRSTPTDGFNNSDNVVNQLIGTDQIGGLKYSADYKSIAILLKGTATGNIQYSLLSQSGENRNVVLTEPVETDYVDSDIDVIN